jgi:multimeric flavodoxin WrbA
MKHWTSRRHSVKKAAETAALLRKTCFTLSVLSLACMFRGKWRVTIMKVVAFNGSGRKDGNTFLLLKTVLEEIAKEGIETKLIQLAERPPIQGCSACFKCAEKRNMKCAIDSDPFNDYFAEISSADGLLLGSPVYFSDITAGMKALIERCGFVGRANGNILRRKVGAGVLAVRRAGSNHALSSLNYLFLISEMIIPGSNYWNMGMGRTPGEVLNDAEGIETMKTLGRNMAWLLGKVGVRSQESEVRR